jgi:flagellar hook protein FlgE
MGLRAMFSSISGLQSDSQWLDVIGNNISNVNTVAFKASRVEFANQFSQALFNGSGGNPSDGSGGIDPQQVGLGTRLASIEAVFTQGTTISTGISTDISIQGNGFLIAKNGSQSYLTRAGDLTFDSDGYLVNPNGDEIQGINATLQYNKDIINTVSDVPGQPLTVTQASLNLNSTNTASLSSIQINRDMTLAPQATTEVDFKGNLDSLQQPNVLDLFPGGVGPSLPVGLTIALIGAANAIDPARMVVQPTAGGGFALQQVDDLSDFVPGLNPPPAPLENGFINLGLVQTLAGSYVWDQQPPTPPASQVEETVYDSLGNPRQITVQFYQVNDLGADGINNPTGPNQVCYAWYAFDTSGGKTVSTANLLGGTGIGEGDPFYDRGMLGQDFFGDFLWFDTDGALASSGGVGGLPGPPGLNANYMTQPRIYLPPNNGFPPLPGVVSPIPTQGAEITPITLNFGTFGLLGTGERDGLYSDAEGGYQVVNGVNTYVPKNTANAASQNGYQEGVLQSLNFDATGVIQGTFSNGQTVGLAQVALDQVQNPEGLDNVGNSDYTQSVNSGPSQVGLAGQGTFGQILDDSLEGSNVDLTVELSNMIIAQRSFDTNSRMIAVINETLDTISHLGQS